MSYTLYNKETDQPVRAGDKLKSFRGETFKVDDEVGAPPHKINSSGSIYVLTPGLLGDCREFYPWMLNCEWRKT